MFKNNANQIFNRCWQVNYRIYIQNSKDSDCQNNPEKAPQLADCTAWSHATVAKTARRWRRGTERAPERDSDVTGDWASHSTKGLNGEGKPLDKKMIQTRDRQVGELRLSYMTGEGINSTNTRKPFGGFLHHQTYFDPVSVVPLLPNATGKKDKSTKT